MANGTKYAAFKKAFPWVAVVLLLAWVTFEALPRPVRADLGLVPAVDRFSYQSWDTEVALSKDNADNGQLTVTETIVALFPEENQNKGIVRGIPVRSQFHVDNLTVTDGDGGQVPHQVERSDDDGMVYVLTGTEHYVHGEQTYVIEYDVEEGLFSNDRAGYDEVSWNLLPTDSAQEIEEFSATIRVDAELTDALVGDAACYQGSVGSSDRCQIESSTDADGTNIYEVSSGPRSPGDGVTIATTFELGTFENTYIRSWEEPSRADQLRDHFGTAPIAIGVLLIALFLSLGAYGIQKRAIARTNSRPDAIVSPVGEVPTTMPPPVATALLRAGQKGAPSLRDARSAQIIHLAVRGAIHLENKSTRFSSTTTVDARLVDPDHAVHELDKRTLRLLFPTFKLDSVREIPKDSEEFSKETLAIAKGGQESATRDGFLVQTQRHPVLATLGAVSALLSVVGFALMFMWFPYAHTAAAVFALIGGVAALSVTLAASWSLLKPPARPTAKGWEAIRHLNGVKAYMEQRRDVHEERAGSDTNSPVGQLYEHDVAANEKLLPYAMLFSLEKPWEKILNLDYKTADIGPNWISGQGTTIDPHWLNAIQYIHTSSTYTPSSSSGSSGGGGGGGGYSGGGGGGGFSGGR